MMQRLLENLKPIQFIHAECCNTHLCQNGMMFGVVDPITRITAQQLALNTNLERGQILQPTNPTKVNARLTKPLGTASGH